MNRKQKISSWNNKILIAIMWIAYLPAGTEGTVLASPTEPGESEPKAKETSEQPESFESESALTGDWGGVRSTLLENGINIGIANTGDLLANSRGVSADVRYANLLEASLTADMDKLAGLTGGSLYIMAIGTHGRDPGEATGSIAAPSNLAANDTFKLFEAWYEQTFFNDRIGILAGLYAVDSEFDAKGTADVFLNGAFGTGLDLSETGLNGPSIFPVTSLGVRVRANITEEITLRATVLDGAPGDPDHPRGTRIGLKKGDGLLIMSELDYQPHAFDFLRFGVGSWLYTADFDDLADTRPNGDPVRREGSYGIYGFVEGVIFNEPDTVDQGLSGFLRIGSADEDVNQIGTFYGAGLVYTGLFPSRDDDVLGLGVTVGINGDKYERALKSAGGSVKDAEIALELTYRAQITPWLSLQPVLQYYINPGTDPALNDNIVGGFRYGVTF
ncbi:MULTISPECIES: carbohydrate porin [Methylomicrobium]|uniref:Carbohydrate-selective porin n=1 Tax=Methylomicrobium album BG8 TaxID=686340 RepID=H8GGU5_METAL|nr:MULTISPECIES: carbohydrate porin [Methylomicrobium]EIC30058.1 carbohydrate-selective porin [Methylomicrobium album BG8]